MNPMKFKIVFFALISTLFFSCKTNDELTNEPVVKGYVEYQYDYTVLVSGETVKKKGYKRFTLTDALFKLYETNDLPDSLINNFEYPDSIAAKFRKVELFFISDDYNIDNILNPLMQSVGTSMVQATLVDTLAQDTDANRILPYGYVNNNFPSLKTDKIPQCLDLQINMNMVFDTLTQSNRYAFSFKGQKTKKVTVFKIHNNLYQITANGTVDSKIYNMYYLGPIRKEANIQTKQPE